MRARLPVEQWPAAYFLKEELEARGIPIQSFLDVICMDKKRWDSLLSGEKGLVLSECERIAGALGVSTEFIANLNLAYRRWKEAQP